MQSILIYVIVAIATIYLIRIGRKKAKGLVALSQGQKPGCASSCGCSKSKKSDK